MSTKSELDFSVNLLQILNTNDKSIVFSPTSILNVLAAILAGCDGISAKELIQALGQDAKEDETIEYYSNIMKHCNDVNKKFIDKNVFRLMFSNCLFLSKEPLLSSFVEKMNKFETDYQQLDFGNVKDIAEVNTLSKDTKINEFVSKNTFNQINEIVSEQDIDPDASLYIVNALYFFGKWENPFDEIYPSLFHSSYKVWRPIQMMSKSIENEGWNFTEGPTWRCLGIPYKNRKSWLHIILPKKTFGLLKLMEKKNDGMLNECIQKQDAGEMDVVIPIFEIENKMSLIEELQKLEINQIFRKKDNHGIQKMFERKNYCTKFIHSAKIEVNEFGTTAAAATVAEMVECCSGPIKRSFTAAQPFIYFVTLVENDVNELKTVLMMGTFY